MLRSLTPLASASASYLGTCPLRSYTELADFRQSDFTGYPVVFCDDRASRMSKPYSGVVHDSSETATLAAKELLSLGLQDYAFVGNLQPREWSEQRRKVFADRKSVV